MPELPDHVVDLQRAADAEHAQLRGLDGEAHAAQWRRWRDAAVAVQLAITQHAADAGMNRAELEAAVKRAVRHPADAAGA